MKPSKLLFTPIILILLIIMSLQPFSSQAQDRYSPEAMTFYKKMWIEAKSSLKLLGIKNIDAEESRYRRSAQVTLRRFENLPKDKKIALSKSSKPLSALHELNINKGLTGGQKIYTPRINFSVPGLNHKPLSSKAATGLCQTLEGSWTNEWEATKLKQDWTIAAGGKITAHATQNGKPKETENLNIICTHNERVRIKKGSTSQDHVFLKQGNQFYLSSNVLYDAFPITSKDNFIVKYDKNYIIYNAGKATVITPDGAAIEGQAKYETLENKEVFNVTYSFPGETTHMGKPRVHNMTMYVLGNYLAHKSLVETGTWVQK